MEGRDAHTERGEDEDSSLKSKRKGGSQASFFSFLDYVFYVAHGVDSKC